MKRAIGNIAVTCLLGWSALMVHAADKNGAELVATAQTVRTPVITEAWARTTMPGQPVGGAYMKISSERDVTLFHVETDVAREVQVHTMHIDKGVMKMREHGPLEIPAEKTVTLAPGGLHMMLLGLKQQLKIGDSISLVMTFVDSNKAKTTTVIKVPVRPIGQ